MERECVVKRTNIWYEPSDLSITFKAILYRFIMWRFRWNYDQLFFFLSSSIYFTQLPRGLFLPDYGLLSEAGWNYKIFTVDFVPTNEIIYHEMLLLMLMLLPSSSLLLQNGNEPNKRKPTSRSYRTEVTKWYVIKFF